MASSKLITVFALLNFVCGGLAARLAVSGTSLTYNGEKVYLNGANIAWNSYGYDFGNGNYGPTLPQWLGDIGAAGGNSVRIWVHVEGFSTPTFDSNGLVTSCDTTGSFINDIKSYLDTAQQNNILVILTLWNGAVLSNPNEVNLFWDDAKMDSYINNCLNGFVQAVAGHPALGAWEAINEPEGSVLIASNPNPCYDTTVIGQSGAGWTSAGIPMERFLRSIGRMNQVFHSLDPSGLVTIGSWAQFSQSDAFSNTHNHYTDACLNGAVDGGSGANLDFYQMHTYDWSGSWSPNAPFTVNAADYALTRPLIIGEFASVCAAGTSLANLDEYAYTHGYAGTLTWHWAATGECSDTRNDQSTGLGYLAGRTDNGVVDIKVG